ncbi:MAG: RdgB/HAM1 family non-canonical purine NTP pyrophosphatase [Ruminococcaceae bacterium]|nr:RdgB/HAM1 family non-canonical purine NTP pyrophosphatase [Oscillospiraceae bacterium]MBR3598063.1 RdgB/HAM1 family non-canonical purine NTP pyrophosphatase [Clostridia bacterium]
MDFLIATHNMKKREELHRIMSPLGINVFLDYEKGISLSDVEETGETFSENALLKARSGCIESGMPCIADDSGLVVDALDGRPGVYSARYMGENTPYPERMAHLVKELEGVPDEKRTARFVAVTACVFPDGREFTVEGTCEGKIGYEPRGTSGFGFDPIFYVGEKTFAELSAEEKDAISHRGNSLRALKEKLAEII